MPHGVFVEFLGTRGEEMTYAEQDIQVLADAFERQLRRMGWTNHWIAVVGLALILSAFIW